MEYLDKLERENDYIWLLDEKNRVLDLVYYYEVMIQGTLCNHEREKAEAALIENRELLEEIKRRKIIILWNLK